MVCILLANYSETMPSLTAFLLDHPVLIHTDLRSKLSAGFAVLQGLSLNPGQAGNRKLEGVQRKPSMMIKDLDFMKTY